MNGIVSQTVRSAFTLQGIDRIYNRLEAPLLGRHQITNAATAVVIAELAAKDWIDLDPAAIDSGLKKTEWPGRFQILSQEPTIFPGFAQIAQQRRSIVGVGRTFCPNEGDR